MWCEESGDSQTHSESQAVSVTVSVYSTLLLEIVSESQRASDRSQLCCRNSFLVVVLPATAGGHWAVGSGQPALAQQPAASLTDTQSHWHSHSGSAQCSLHSAHCSLLTALSAQCDSLSAEC